MAVQTSWKLHIQWYIVLEHTIYTIMGKGLKLVLKEKHMYHNVKIQWKRSCTVLSKSMDDDQKKKKALHNACFYNKPSKAQNDEVGSERCF